MKSLLLPLLLALPGVPPAAAESVPKAIDWLHVPKCGSSFAYALLFYACDLEVAKHYGSETGLEMSQEMATSVNKKKMPCLSGIPEAGHRALGPSVHAGHTSFSVEQVYTMIRPPLRRTASGFVYHLHDCEFPLKKAGWKVTAEGACKALLNPNSGPHTREKLDNIIRDYGSCASACMTRMITGGICGHHTYEAQYNAAQKKVAKAKIDRMAFVGMTERWVESTCLFGKMFPRESGKPYPPDTTKNSRPGPSKQCEKMVEEILIKQGYRDPMDEAVYDHAEARFERDLARFPECKSSKARPATWQPTLLL